ncbi:Germinal-center associated nuclear protein [Pseudolycoriella hygida]|uniref:Germinal-center associated nuclear protein n=1 Tax=Pseudolycoriella hygida TaxID=35572 RepID=A0A9Q0N6S1_9DIPT|nr:Germinal-center associated nuclear protein [Pseudolycoriella hygida]
MNLNYFVKGSCNNFCPPNEIKMRTHEKLLHFYELYPPLSYTRQTKNLPIKCFARSAAGTETPRSSDLRTFNSLFGTVEYLLTHILVDDRKPYHFRYDFIFDRLRSVRQEIVIQNFDEEDTIKLIEPVIMFLSYSRYDLIVNAWSSKTSEESLQYLKLCQSPVDTFDPKICDQHLLECLKKLLGCYDEIEQQQRRTQPRNREFFECLYMVFNLGNVDALNRAVGLSASLNGDLFSLCLYMSLQYFNGYFHNSIRTVKSLPPILCAIATLSLQKIRRYRIKNLMNFYKIDNFFREILIRFSSAYHSKTLTVPSKWLSDLLLYDDMQLLLADCRYYNIEICSNSSFVKFNKFTFERTKNVIAPRHETFVDMKMLPVRVSDVLLLR